MFGKPQQKRKRKDAIGTLELHGRSGYEEVPEGEPQWKVRKIALCRDKAPSGTTELVRREVLSHFEKAANPIKEWYIQVSVYNRNVIQFVGEVVLSDTLGVAHPSEELQRMVDFAHERADFLNINGVELPGAQVIENYAPPTSYPPKSYK